MFLRKDGRNSAVIARHHQTTLVTPRPVLVSVLVVSGQPPPSRRGDRLRGAQPEGTKCVTDAILMSFYRALHKCNEMAFNSVLVADIDNKPGGPL
jgi:hypothetical protein